MKSPLEIPKDFPNTLNHLIELDPTELTDDDIDTIVRGMRAWANNWAITERQPKGKKKKDMMPGLTLDHLFPQSEFDDVTPPTEGQ